MAKARTIIILAMAVLWAACTPTNTPDERRVASTMSKSAKRGVAFNFAVAEDLPLLSDAISWDYNWGNDQNPTAASWMDMEGIDFCPMCWSGNYSADRIRAYVAAHPNTKYLLAFNEPNLKDQARMTPAEAAAMWAPVVALAKELKLKLVSPAMNYGTLAGYSDPIKWLDEFFAQPGVSIDDIDAISIHCYMANPQALRNYVAMFYKYNKPIWLTEFCAWEEYAIHSEEDQMTYMCSVLNYLEQDSNVERYAWFIPRYKPGFPYMPLLTYYAPYELTSAGKVYCGFSSFDRSVWFRGEKQVQASNYIGVSDFAVQVRPSSDGEGLMLSRFAESQYADYQIYIPSDVQTIALRYAALGKAIVAIWIDDEPTAITSLAATGGMDEWTIAEIAASLKAGYHTLRLEMQEGVININWFKLN
ncbi:MAG: carbohydrate-binding protein [Paludibacteraceae bacterium]|nr:carbohydrate-binding protein [Paludibacteraceae bacterium]